ECDGIVGKNAIIAGIDNARSQYDSLRISLCRVAEIERMRLTRKFHEPERGIRAADCDRRAELDDHRRRCDRENRGNWHWSGCCTALDAHADRLLLQHLIPENNGDFENPNSAQQPIRVRDSRVIAERDSMRDLGPFLLRIQY